MTEQQALLAAIIADPADDLPRMLYANYLDENYLDENGESERAEFVRVQLQLARPKMDCHHHPWAPAGAPWCEVCQLRQREDVLLFSHEQSWHPCYWQMLKTHHATWNVPNWDWSRGFISRLVCPWTDWLKAAESLYWHPSQTVSCPTCSGTGAIEQPSAFGDCRVTCPTCWVNDREKGIVSRPCPLTAQPLEEVRLTTRPINSDAIDTAKWFTVAIGAKLSEFDRLKCEACDGSGLWSAPSEDRPETHMTVAPCPDCHGEPLNRWTCPTWPSVVFVMPENSR